MFPFAIHNGADDFKTYEELPKTPASEMKVQRSKVRISKKSIESEALNLEISGRKYDQFVS